VEASAADLREAALRLLARREHSFRELTQKLARRGWPEKEIETTLEELAELGLLSDQRYAESFARSRAGKHYGPVRIRAELGERGIDRDLIDKTLKNMEFDWLESAVAWYERRHGIEPPADLKEKSRRQQALARRGFNHDMIREIIS
jgi:regulatory protein